MRTLGWSRAFLSQACILACVLCAPRAFSQAQFGDNAHITAYGDLGFGYNAVYGDLPSSHSDGFASNFNADGYYFHPNFLNFQARSYYDRAQGNSEVQNINRSNGYSGSVGLFGGSNFPVSISYGQDFSSDSELSIAGVPAVFGDSNSKSFSIGGSATAFHLPTIGYAYSQGTSSSSVYGSDLRNTAGGKSFVANTGYEVLGFRLQGRYNWNSYNWDSPDFLTGFGQEGDASNSTFMVNGQRKIPLRGGMGFAYSHANYANDGNARSSGDSYSIGAGITPINRVSLSGSLAYSTTLSQALQNTVNADGSSVLLNKDFPGSFFSQYVNSAWSVRRGLMITGHLTHTSATLNGYQSSNTQYGGTFSYQFAQKFLHMFRFNAGVIDTATQNGNGGAGFTGSVSMDHRFGRWDTSADFNYNQSLQTTVVLVNSSNFSYGGSIRRKFNRTTYWSVALREAHSGMNPVTGSSNHAESYSTTFKWRRYMTGATFSNASGTALLGVNGQLTPTDIAPQVSNVYYLYNAKSFNVSLSTHLQRLGIGGGYARAWSSNGPNIGVANTSASQSYNVGLSYYLRKFSINGGFSRAEQALGSASGPMSVVNSFHVSITRWFQLL